MNILMLLLVLVCLLTCVVCMVLTIKVVRLNTQLLDVQDVEEIQDLDSWNIPREDLIKIPQDAWEQFCREESSSKGDVETIIMPLKRRQTVKERQIPILWEDLLA